MLNKLTEESQFEVSTVSVVVRAIWRHNYLTSRISVSSSKTCNCHRTRNGSFYCCYYCFHWPVLNKSADLQWPLSIPRIPVGCIPDGVRLRSSRTYIIQTLYLVTLTVPNCHTGTWRYYGSCSVTAMQFDCLCVCCNETYVIREAQAWRMLGPFVSSSLISVRLKCAQNCGFCYRTPTFSKVGL